MLERGDFVPQEAENWNPEAVWKHLRYQTKERWLDERGREFRPYTHYNVGGNTKFWGSVLYRLRREDFQAVEHRDGVSPAWPIDYETLAPYYDRAEQLYHVRGAGRRRPDGAAARPVSVRGRAARAGHGRHRRAAARLGLHPSPLPLGLLRPGEETAASCATPAIRSSAASTRRARPTSARASGAARMPNVTLWTSACARRLITDARGAQARGGRGRARRANGARRSAALRRLVRRRQLGGAAAALGQRSPSRAAWPTRPGSSAAATWRTSRR